MAVAGSILIDMTLITACSSPNAFLHTNAQYILRGLMSFAIVEKAFEIIGFLLTGILEPLHAAYGPKQWPDLAYIEPPFSHLPVSCSF
ncbi:hypothetical protein NEOLEDRAFT_968092 [Neolentinus lepideus HHB14362 ss-1]|uniref:Uncharacterized protein n=1 Tax=Neolentinus lepideus HHB14362 ss-1 TaxID=1314782 RepID=A0A165ND18_9AGAM|nr:hypothetical protein NEOLEDRAFT_968092 [Neolentinus lepideus HHB14362 ss-1]